MALTLRIDIQTGYMGFYLFYHFSSSRVIHGFTKVGFTQGDYIYIFLVVNRDTPASKVKKRKENVYV